MLEERIQLHETEGGEDIRKEDSVAEEEEGKGKRRVLAKEDRQYCDDRL